MQKNKAISTKRIALMSIFSALSIAILFVIPAFPIFPSVPFLVYDFADVPIFILTMILGVPEGLIVTFIVCLIQGFLLSSSGILGVLMHVVATSTFVIVFGLIFRKHKTIKMGIIAEVCGIIAWVIVMTLFNIIITPIYMGVPRDAVYPLLLPAIIPFNAIKSSGNATISLVLFFSINKLSKNKLLH